MLLSLFGLALATVQDAPLIHSSFAQGEDGWVVAQPLGSGAKVAAVHEPANLKVGPGSLSLTYAIGAGQMAGATLPVTEGALTKLGSIHFWIKTAHNMPVGVALQEKGGGQYVGMISVPKDKWQEVELGVQDFVPSDNAGTPPDPNGKLDLDHVESITVIDVSQFLAQVPNIAGLLGLQNGERSLLLSDVQLLTKPVPDTNTATDTEYLFDNFLRPEPAWTILNATGAILEAAPMYTRALRLDYNLTSEQACAAAKRVKVGSLTGKKTLNLHLASSHPCQLLVQLEERAGGKYNAVLPIPGGPDPIDRTIDITAMTPDEQTKDPNGKLDLDQVQQLTIVDLTAVTQAPGANVLWIGKVTAKN